MVQHVVKIISTDQVTHNVKRFKLTKPDNYVYVAGQATEVAVNSPELKNERRPFTFTSLNTDSYLEFTIKIYPDHNGVTNALNQLKAGDELLIHDIWGAIAYKGEGVFIAGGAGITPFIAIFRQLHSEGKTGKNRLIFSNRTDSDIILKEEFEDMLGDNFIIKLTENGKRIDKEYLKAHISDFGQHFYICGPEKFTSAIQSDLIKLGAKVDSVVFEK